MLNMRAILLSNRNSSQNNAQPL